MSEKILIINRIEDILDKGEVVGRQVFDGTGESLKVKIGQGGRLKERWDELQIGRAYSFTMGEFKGFPFVQDFKSVGSQFVKQAQKQVEDKQINTKDRAVSASYAKDLVIGNKVNLGQMFEWADKFYDYIKGDKDVKTPKDVSDEETKPEPVADTTGVDDIGGDVKNPQELMAWALSHDKKYGPSWVRQQAHIGVNAKITDEMVAEIHKSIKAVMGWKD